MGFKRIWDSSCPRVWDTWEGDGVTWVIRDLRPEDDEDALKILVETLCAEEMMCAVSDFVNDPESVRNISKYWRRFLSQRMSLGCYQEKDGQSELVALNVCHVDCEEDRSDNITVVEGKAWQNVYSAMAYCENAVDTFKLLGTDKNLYSRGLAVSKEYRGAKLGSRLLAAREPLARFYGIKGTCAVFLGSTSQICAEHAGFSTAATFTLKDLAEAGFDFPRDESKCIKVMVKKYA